MRADASSITSPGYCRGCGSHYSGDSDSAPPHPGQVSGEQESVGVLRGTGATAGVRQFADPGGPVRGAASTRAGSPECGEGSILFRARTCAKGEGRACMELLERFEEAAEAQRGRGAVCAAATGHERTMESRTHCAYNQTRECFLGLEVKAADLPSTRVGELMSARPLKSGEGVWMTPFRGIPAAAMPAPLDLIYLDEDCRVIDTVESFPTFQVSSSSPQPKSVLALPAHSIYSSQTQAGDQLVLCVAEEMGQATATAEQSAQRGGSRCRRRLPARCCCARSRCGAAGRDCWSWKTGTAHGNRPRKRPTRWI